MITPGLILSPHTVKRGRPLEAAPEQYVTPAHLDRRPELLPCSNQGSTPRCAAFAMAGWLEYYRWKVYGLADQVDPDPIYKKAKEIDGLDHMEGTTLEAVLNASMLLGLIPHSDVENVRDVSAPGEVQQAIHRYGVVLAAFDVTDQWSYAATGGWIRPGGKRVGGHAVVLCGYSTLESPPWYAIQNSWGENQGWRGFNRLSFDLFAEQFQYGLVWDAKR